MDAHLSVTRHRVKVAGYTPCSRVITTAHGRTEIGRCAGCGLPASVGAPYTLRRFLRWSEKQAAEVGLTPGQHQLLLAIRGSGDAAGPTIGDVAESLVLRHHSTVELVDSAVAGALVLREPDDDDHRIVRLQLTETAVETLEQLTAQHLEEVRRLTSLLAPAFLGGDDEHP